MQAAIGESKVGDGTTECRAVPINCGWDFHRGRAARSWVAGIGERVAEQVSLPHCWNARDAFQDGVRYYRGWGSYRRPFCLPPLPAGAGDGEWRFVTEGFYGTGDVWLDGRRLARVDGQYLGISLGLGRTLRAEETHTIGVRLTNRCARHVLPGIRMPDFLLYGGLSGRARLEWTPTLRFDEAGSWVRGDCTTSSCLSAAVEFRIVNDSPHRRRARATWRIRDADGAALAQAETPDVDLAPGETRMATVVVPVPGAELWQLHNPKLYTAEGSLLADGAVTHDICIRFGFRDAVFRPGEGFYLNGERVPLQGCNRHESMPGFGRALPLSCHRGDAALIKELGFNFVRLSHYPQHPAFLDACDELGLLVYAEIATWKRVTGGRWLRAACRQMEGLVRRDRSRPCVILWGMGNEGRLRRAYLRLAATVRNLDRTRPVIYAENHLYRARRRKTLGLPDVWGTNYELDVLDEACRSARLNCAVVSECANYPHSLRGDPERERTQLDMIVADVERIEGQTGVAGFALWCFNDYATLRKERYKRYSGIVDAWRIPKMAAAFLGSRHAGEPRLRVFGAWGSPDPAVRAAAGAGEGDMRSLYVVTNCERVTVDRAADRADESRSGPCMRFDLEYDASPLVFTGWLGGRATSLSLLPYGAATGIQVSPLYDGTAAAVGDAVPFDVTVVDGAGRLAAAWFGTMKVRVEGPGRVCCYRSDDVVEVSGGRGRGFLEITGVAGAVVVIVESEGLCAGEARMQGVASPRAEQDLPRGGRARA